ncbi:glycosyl hydrolase [marine bacterium AO1-C]|nr:glycosyl hydrolase [marine bacterium AO1-C]
MSFRNAKVMNLTGVHHNDMSEKELVDLYNETLQAGMHGLCFSPYVEGQKPGDQLTEAQIQRRMQVIKPHTQWVRSFSCTDGNELIARVAKAHGLKTLVGAWLGDDPEINQREIEGLIRIAKEGIVDIAAVGNEVMYRGDLTEEELLKFIYQVKEALPANIPVGYVDAYYEFAQRPRITKACDVILSNCYPFWEGCHCDYSLPYMKDMYHQAVRAGQGKKVIITETGWPSKGSNLHGAEPSEANFMKYFINTQQWSKEEGIEIFYFSSFDESWKVGDEGDVGAYWGLWEKDERPKFVPASVVV